MATEIELVRRALLLLGETNIATSISDLDTAPLSSRVAAEFLPIVEKNALLLAPWRFATKIATLNQLIDPPPIAEFTKQYELPSDLLVLWRFYPLVHYRLYERRIFTNALAPFQAEYTFNIKPGGYPFDFERFVYTSLASEIAMSVTKKPAIAQLMFQKAQEALMVARFNDAQQSPSDIIRSQPLFTAHFAGGLSGGLPLR